MTTKIIKNKAEEKLIEGKISYIDKVYYKLNFPKDFSGEINEGSEVQEGDYIKPKEAEKKGEIIEIPYKGRTELLLGGHVKPGDILYTTQNLFKKKSIKSDISGVVSEVSEESISIEVKNEDGEKPIPIKYPFGGKISQLGDGFALMEFPAVQVVLFDIKGGSATGPIRYIPSQKIKDEKNPPTKIDGSIVITDYLTSELYPMLSTLGASAIIANSVDYSLFRNMIILAVPIGIVSGFGYTPSGEGKSEVEPVLNEDEPLIKYIKSIEGKMVWVDGDYSRLIIPEPREPMSLKRHKFKICQSF